jgi:8-oxo-dGTP diphosphatase
VGLCARLASLHYLRCRRRRLLLRSSAVPDIQRSVIDVFLLLTRGDEVLLGLREGTGFADGMWNLPSGKAEQDETAVAAVAREAREEIGVILCPGQLSFAAAVQCRNSAADVRMGLFFHAEASADLGAGPFNAEPHKCAKVAWYPLSMLPEPVMPYSALGVSLYLSGARYATLGW